MKFWLVYLLLSLVINTASASVLRGGSDVGGGMGVVCHDPSGAIESVELLDLWEARVVYGRNLVVSDDSVEQQLNAAIEQLKDSIYSGEFSVRDAENLDLRGPEALKWMLKWDTDRFLIPGHKQVRRVRGARLKKTEDSFEVVTPKDCEIAQLVRYADTHHGGFILIDQDLVDKMDATNEAALYIHEAMYALLRPSEKSSLRVRRAIGLTFSGYTFTQPSSFLPDEYYSCQDGKNRVFAYMDKSPTNGEPVAAFLVERIEGLKVIDFQGPTSWWRDTSIEEIFDGAHPFSSLMSLSEETAYDYGISVSIGGEQGKRIARVQLTSAPDHETLNPEAVLTCKKIRKDPWLPKPVN